MVQAASRWPVIAENRIRSQANTYGIFSGTDTAFLQELRFSPVTIILLTFISSQQLIASLQNTLKKYASTCVPAYNPSRRKSQLKRKPCYTR